MENSEDLEDLDNEKTFCMGIALRIAKRTAQKFLNETILQVNGKKFRIGEIEIYLYNSDHQDMYVHKDPLQMNKWNWYFHKKGKSFKEGTFKGLDITMGEIGDEETGDTGCYFGVLIRSLYNVQEKQFIEGPCNSVMEILREYNCEKVKDFIKVDEVLNCFENHRNLILKKVKMRQREIYTGPRIGLSDKYPEFRDLPYRFTCFKEFIKKKKGTLLQLSKQ
jgi:3-methyladenine DNA glycosylase Mpg